MYKAKKMHLASNWFWIQASIVPLFGIGLKLNKFALSQQLRTSDHYILTEKTRMTSKDVHTSMNYA